MRIIGLTGSIGMGKSTAAARLRQHGIAVFDADAEVHRLYSGPLATEIEAAFPGTTTAGGVDRRKLSAALLAEPARFKTLESIVHPRVRAEQVAFLVQEFNRGANLAVLEIPLLFEAGMSALVDATIVVSAEPAIQRRRVLARADMSEAKLDAILRRQWQDLKKRSCADFVVDTSGPPAACNAQIDAILPKLETVPALAYERHWAA
jgi:dephospho-CoA kinase